jgi:fatty-acyl-CoA synthase
MYEINLTEAFFRPQADAELRNITVGELLRESADRYPDASALVDIALDGAVGRDWNYCELLAMSERLAVSLASRFDPGERVVVWAPNIPEWIFMEYACALTGLVLVTANPSFQAKELRYVLEQSGAVALFLIDSFRSNPMTEIANDAISGNKVIREVVNLEDEAALFKKGPRPAELPGVKPTDPAQIQYTSGTTGFPKGAVLSHYNLVNNACLFAARKKVHRQSVWANFMPMFHTAGCATTALGSLQAGCKMLMIKLFDANVLARLIESEGVTTFFAVPTMLVALLQALESEDRNMLSMEVISTGGAPVAPELVRKVRDRLSCSLQSAFGQTEASPMICFNHDDVTLDDICYSAGQPLPHTGVSIRHPETGAVLAVGEIGEICAQGYNVMIGYHDNEEATRAAIDGDGWLHTGDLGKLDQRGFIRVTGRVKDMIIRGGENHFPVEIENTLIEHPQVAEVAVVGIPDEKWGEAIAAFIRTKDNKTLNIDDLKSTCRRYLSSQKTPTIWRRVSTFPLTGSGKIQKFRIRDKYLSGDYD